MLRRCAAPRRNLAPVMLHDHSSFRWLVSTRVAAAKRRAKQHPGVIHMSRCGNLDKLGIPAWGQAPVELPEGITFEEYLARPLSEDVATETFLDPLSLGDLPGKGTRGLPEVCAGLLICAFT